MTDSMGYTPHVLVVGGGATGVATARDLAIRGLDVTLVEQGRLTAGATGRMTGLLYSGAGHARDAPALAARCLEENRTLRSIAGHCLVDSGGLLVQHTADRAELFEETRESCQECDIPAETVDGETAREYEPALSEDVEQALAVPDATVDPFALTVATARSAKDHGAEIYTRVRVTDITVADGTVSSVVVTPNPPAGAAADSVDLPGSESDDKDDEDDDATSPGSTTGSSEKTAPGSAKKTFPGQAEGEGSDSDALRRARERRESAAGSEESEGGDDADGTSGGESGSDDGGSAKAGGDRDTDGSAEGKGDTDEVQDETTEAEPLPERTLEPDFVVNAAGGWVGEVAGLADIDVPVSHTKGGIAVSNAGEVGRVVRRCRAAEGANTAVPMAGNCMLGTIEESADGPGEESGDSTAADRLIEGVGAILPAVENAQILRTYWGVRSTVGDEESAATAVDHAQQDDVWGLVTVASATLTTHRLAAERVTDHVCGEFGIGRDCQTGELTLPGSDGAELREAMDEFDVNSPISREGGPAVAGGAAVDRGTAVAGGADDEPETDGTDPLICSCMDVTRSEIRAAMDDDTGTETDLNDVRIRTWAAMGECQGGRCAHRMATELYPEQDIDTISVALDDLYEERWRGQRHGLGGDGLTRAMRNYLLHAETMNRDREATELDLEQFDDGPDPAANGRDRWGGGVPY